MEWEPFDREFYEVSALELAPRLLGHWLLRRENEGWTGGRVVEVEAYLENDPASHAFAGRTPRNESMWGAPGFSYVYLIYGMHYCFNAVCLPAGRAEAVLVRAIEADLDPARMQSRRDSLRMLSRNNSFAEPRGQTGLSATSSRRIASLTNGPAKLCQALGITRLQDAADLCRVDSAVFIARNPEVAPFLAARGPMVATPRIGISAAADHRLRFILPGSAFLSRRRPKNEVAFRQPAG